MHASIHATIRKIYLYKALNDFILLYPLYNIMFAERGLSPLQISSLLIIWSLTDLVTNVPSGALADKFSRKHLLALSQLIEAAGFLSWLVWPSYYGFALGFILWGIGGALFDGTYEALVFDELEAADMQHQYVRVMGRANSFALMANLAATILAGAAIVLGYPFVIGASVAVMIVSAVVALSLPATRRAEMTADPRYFAMLRDGIREAVHNRALLGIIALGGFIGAIYGSLEEYVPLLLNEAKFGRSFVPPLVALTVGAAALASWYAHRCEHWSTRRLLVLTAVAGGCLAFVGAASGYGLVALVVGYTVLIKLGNTIFDGKVQHTMSGAMRATVTSVSLFVLELMSIGTYTVYGLLAGAGGNRRAFGIIGAVVVVIALVYLVVAPRLLARKSAALLA